MSIWVEKSSIKIIEIVIYNRIVWASNGKCVRSKKEHIVVFGSNSSMFVKIWKLLNMQSCEWSVHWTDHFIHGNTKDDNLCRPSVCMRVCLCVWKLAEPSKSSNHFALIEVFSYHFWSSIHCIWKTTKRMPSSPSRHVCLSLTFISRTWWKKRFSRLCEETEYETEYNAP